MSMLSKLLNIMHAVDAGGDVNDTPLNQTTTPPPAPATSTPAPATSTPATISTTTEYLIHTDDTYTLSLIYHTTPDDEEWFLKKSNVGVKGYAAVIPLPYSALVAAWGLIERNARLETPHVVHPKDLGPICEYMHWREVVVDAIGKVRRMTGEPFTYAPFEEFKKVANSRELARASLELRKYYYGFLALQYGKLLNTPETPEKKENNPNA